MPKTLKDLGSNGDVIQVFMPTQRIAQHTLSVSFGQVVRFSQNAQYEFDDDGVKVPFTAGMAMAIPQGATSLKLYDYDTGAALTPQVIEVMA